MIGRLHPNTQPARAYLIVKVPGAPQVCEKLAANHILHHKVDVAFVLKGAVQVHDERVIDHVEQNVALCDRGGEREGRVGGTETK